MSHTKKFEVVSEFVPEGDQPKAIKQLSEGILNKKSSKQVLLGITGSGKTFTMAKVIEEVNKHKELPVLVISHNKTLAAQLYQEFKEFFPNNAVEYFVSYYDYYQPEAYVPSRDLYIEKETDINEEIDRLRNSTTRSLLERKDVIVVASVSCIYGLGSPEFYRELGVLLEKNSAEMSREEILTRLTDMQYERNEMVLERGKFRAKGDVIEVYPSYEDVIIRIELFGDEIDTIKILHIVNRQVLEEKDSVFIFPAKHYVMPQEIIDDGITGIKELLEERVEYFEKNNKLVEAQRLQQRTEFDLEMLQTVGYCSGIENYSVHFSPDRKPGTYKPGNPGTYTPGDPPSTLIDFFQGDYLLFIDESHVTIPQIRGMSGGDRSRKFSLVEYGFRLPTAYDNRPLVFEEFNAKLKHAVYVSATPAPYEVQTADQVVEQIIRPTGLLDPDISVRKTEGQIDDLINEIQEVISREERVLVTTLTKKMAENLAEYLQDAGLKCRYLHSEITTLERTEIISDLRKGTFDVLVGINLLREGLDLPEVSLVAILDADKEGFLRTSRSLIQTIGRASRNVNGKVILYADTVTSSMEEAIYETRRRRQIQEDYNRNNAITPETIKKSIREMEITKKKLEPDIIGLSSVPDTIEGTLSILNVLRGEMEEAAAQLDFERAAKLRDQIKEFQKDLSDDFHVL
ncbi:MAG: excinuclease ABC subunit UvrB [Candidatus Odinarchaeota archaeon]